jgi:hypothetical protein
MDRFIHAENIALFRKRLADPYTTADQRRTIERLLEEEEEKLRVASSMFFDAAKAKGQSIRL